MAEQDNPLNNVPDDDLMEIWQAIQEGAKTPAEALDFDDAAMNSTEAIAASCFESEQYDRAATLYSFLLRMDPGRHSAWRGLGITFQAQGLIDFAVIAFTTAMENVDPSSEDGIITRIYLGECLCRRGDRQPGLNVLKAALEEATETTRNQPYLHRARLIVKAEGVLARPKPPPAIQALLDQVAAQAEEPAS